MSDLVRLAAVALLLLGVTLQGASVVAEQDDDAVAAGIARLLSGQQPELRGFYQARAGRPAWPDDQAVAALAAAIGTLDGDGLRPTDYHPTALLPAHHLAQAAAEPLARARFDLQLSELLLTVLHHVQRGKLDPAAIDPNWELPRTAPRLDLAAVSQAVDARQFDQLIAAVRPDHLLHARLRSALKHYRDIKLQGGWPMLPARHDALHPGDRDADVPLLRQRLAIEEGAALPVSGGCNPAEAAVGGPDPYCHDENLVAAVHRFQRRHLLREDGIVGRQTLAALNVPVATRIEQIRANLERARWLLHGLPRTFVLVDIAGYRLSYFRPDGTLWQSRIMVGRPYRSTPMLRSEINRLTFNPTWTVPPTILREDMLPMIRKDPDYLTREDIEVISLSGAPLDPRQIDWWHPGNLLLRQRAGPHNALGRVAIRFPNRHDVYLHDTPAQGLFNLDRRAISSGCIRVANALELARLLLDDEKKWNQAAIDELVASGLTREVALARRVPLILYYWTVAVDAEGVVSFRPDIYQRDAAVLAALNRPLAAAAPSH